MENTHFVEKKNGNSTSLAFSDLGAEAGEEGFDVLPSDVRARWVRKNRFQCSLMGALHVLYGTRPQYRAQPLRFLMPNVRAKRAPTAGRAGQQAQNGAKPPRLMAGVACRWRSA